MLGGFAALVGVFILSMPVPIIVNSFTTQYQEFNWRTEVNTLRRIHDEKVEEEKAKQRVTKCLHEIASGRPKNDTQDAELINPLRRFSQQLFYRVKRQNNNNN